LGMLGSYAKPPPDGLVFMAGDFLGGAKAPPPHQDEQGTAHLRRGSPQPVHRRSIREAKGMAALAADPTRAAILAAIADDVSGPAIRTNRIVRRRLPSHFSPPPGIIP
ncbi:MAG: hypothetical protein QXZ25_05795, partial [Candidatus Bathyarchaeia archaeon]